MKLHKISDFPVLPSVLPRNKSNENYWTHSFQLRQNRDIAYVIFTTYTSNVIYCIWMQPIIAGTAKYMCSAPDHRPLFTWPGHSPRHSFKNIDELIGLFLTRPRSGEITKYLDVRYQLIVHTDRLNGSQDLRNIARLVKYAHGIGTSCFVGVTGLVINRFVYPYYSELFHYHWQIYNCFSQCQRATAPM